MFRLVINKKSWLCLVGKAWNEFLDDVEKLGERGGFLHSREEDMRSYLFCKLVDILNREKMWLIDLRTELSVERKRLDLALGINNKKCSLGIEVKPNMTRTPVSGDLNKLKDFLKKGCIETGVFIGINKHRDSWDRILENWFEDVGLSIDKEDKGDNNYWNMRVLKPIYTGEKMEQFDSLFIVFRKIS